MLRCLTKLQSPHCLSRLTRYDSNNNNNISNQIKLNNNISRTYHTNNNPFSSIQLCLISWKKRCGSSISRWLIRRRWSWSWRSWRSGLRWSRGGCLWGNRRWRNSRTWIDKSSGGIISTWVISGNDVFQQECYCSMRKDSYCDYTKKTLPLSLFTQSGDI